MKHSLIVSHKVKQTLNILPSNSTPRCLPKIHNTGSQKDLFTYVNSFIQWPKTEEEEKKKTCPPTGELTKKNYGIFMQWNTAQK